MALEDPGSPQATRRHGQEGGRELTKPAAESQLSLPTEEPREVEENRGLLRNALSLAVEAQAEIERLRDLIGMQTCPLKPGDIISISDNGRNYEGIVEMVGGVFVLNDVLQPNPDAQVLWAVKGHHLRKSDRNLSKWSFGFDKGNAIHRGGTWILAQRGIEAFLGLVDRFPAQEG